MSSYECRICGERAADKGVLIGHVDRDHDTVPWFVEAAISEVD